MTEITVKKRGALTAVRHGLLLARRLRALQRLLLKHLLLCLTGHLRILVRLLVLSRHRGRGEVRRVRGEKTEGEEVQTEGRRQNEREIRFQTRMDPKSKTHAKESRRAQHKGEWRE
jgi:hypothetical protein